MPYVTEVRTTDGGNRLVIGAGGTLEVEQGATVTGLDTGSLEPGAAVADATDTTDVVQQFNALLASLRAAGHIAT